MEELIWMGCGCGICSLLVFVRPAAFGLCSVCML